MIEQNKELFADPSNVLEAHLALAPHQSWAIDIKESNMQTVALTHWGDVLSDDDINGDVVSIATGKPSLEGIKQNGHKVSSFLSEAKLVINRLKYNKGAGNWGKYNGLDGLLKDQSDFNRPQPIKGLKTNKIHFRK